MLALEGIPLYYMELCIGQRMRKGSVGVWSEISPYLGGVGIASVVVCFLVSLYYNVIIAWCVFYFFKSFEHPLPWSSCPLEPVTVGNITTMGPVHECNVSASATTYFWYRTTLQISSNIEDSGGINWKIYACLIGTWVLIWLCMMKGTRITGKVEVPNLERYYITEWVLWTPFLSGDSVAQDRNSWMYFGDSLILNRYYGAYKQQQRRRATRTAKKKQVWILQNNKPARASHLFAVVARPRRGTSRTWTQDNDFLLFFLNFNITPEEFPNIKQIVWHGARVIYFETARTCSLRGVFAAVAVVVAYTLDYWRWWRWRREWTEKNCPFLFSEWKDY